MKKAIIVLMIAMLAQMASAKIIVTEIMYNPSQADDSDAEWIEIYNNGDAEEDLALWQINGKRLSGVLPAKTYLVIAKELVDGDDNDEDSFESIWGNNDGIWDENDGFLAIKAYISLSNTEGVINLTNGNETEILNYNSKMGANGNGKSLERINLSAENVKTNWGESIIDGGTPGKPNSISVELLPDEIEFCYEIANIPPSLMIEILPDEMEKEGVQVVSGDKEIKVRVYVEDENGVDDITNVSAFIESKPLKLEAINISNETIVYEGTIRMRNEYEKRIYKVIATAFDNSANTTAYAEFEYIGVISTIIETRKIDFGEVRPNKVSEVKEIAITNAGTTAVKINFESKENFEMLVEGEWKSISKAELVLQQSERKEIKVRAKAGKEKARKANGKIKIVSTAI